MLSVSYTIYLGEAVLCFLIPCSFWSVQMIECIMDHYAMRRIWRYWISILLVRYILSSVCLRSSKFSQSFFMQHMSLCVFDLSIYLMMIVGISVLYLNIIIKLEVWPLCHCLRFGHETMVCVVRLSKSFWIRRHIFKSTCIAFVDLSAPRFGFRILTICQLRKRCTKRDFIF